MSTTARAYAALDTVLIRWRPKLGVHIIRENIALVLAAACSPLPGGA
jgi:hypothetical protein